MQLYDGLFRQGRSEGLHVQSQLGTCEDMIERDHHVYIGKYLLCILADCGAQLLQDDLYLLLFLKLQLTYLVVELYCGSRLYEKGGACRR